MRIKEDAKDFGFNFYILTYNHSYLQTLLCSVKGEEGEEGLHT